VIPALFKI